MSLHMTCVIAGDFGGTGTSYRLSRATGMGHQLPRCQDTQVVLWGGEAWDEELSSLVTLVLTGQAVSGLPAATKENPGHVPLHGLPS